MKTRIIFFSIFYFATLVASAQSSGVYLSAVGFASGKLAYEINCSTEKHKIKLNEFLTLEGQTTQGAFSMHSLRIISWTDFQQNHLEKLLCKAMAF